MESAPGPLAWMVGAVRVKVLPVLPLGVPVYEAEAEAQAAMTAIPAASVALELVWVDGRWRVFGHLEWVEGLPLDEVVRVSTEYLEGLEDGDGGEDWGEGGARPEGGPPRPVPLRLVQSSG